MDQNTFLQPTIPYLDAFAEHDPVRRLELLGRAMTPDAEIWGPSRVFAGYAEISQKIEGFHKNWPGCRLVITSGPNTFRNAARFGCAIVRADGSILASGQSVVELGKDGRYQRVIPFWEDLPPLPADWPEHLAPKRGNMCIERIFTRPQSGTSQVAHDSVRVVAGAGIEGDRYFGAMDEPGQNITFVEAEEIERFAAERQIRLDLSVTARNVVTRGVRLNELVGREFLVGSVRFRGVEACEPCLGLGEALSSAGLTPAEAVKRWHHRAGLRADVLSSGELTVGAKFQGAA